MYYFMSRGNCKRGYRFLYNDTDKSVRYILSSDTNNINIADKPIRDNKSHLNKYRLFFGRVKEINQGYAYFVCKYKIGNLPVVLTLVLVERKARLTLFFLGDFEFVKETEEFGFINFGYKAMYLYIPFRMVDYILDLKSRHDFNGLMYAFSGLIGENLHNIVREVNSSEVKFDSWDE